MPLSDHEQRILEEIEKGLYEEDPAFGRATRRRSLDDARNVKWGVMLFLMGFALLLGFFLSSSIIIGVAAFGSMVGGVVIVAGSVKTLIMRRAERGGVLRSKLEHWEERLRQRYKRP